MSAKFEILSSKNYSFQCSVFLEVYPVKKLARFLSSTWNKYLFVIFQNYANIANHQVVNNIIILNVTQGIYLK